MTRETRLAMLSAPLTRCVQDSSATGYQYTATGTFYLPIPPHLMPPCGFENEWIYIQPPRVDGWSRFGILRAYSTDGCTGGPDFSLGATLRRCVYKLQHAGPEAALRLCGAWVAHWPHDGIYQFVRAIAKAFGWSIWRTIRWANRYFNWIMQECGTPQAQRWTYAAGVAVFGHAFAWFGRQKRAIVDWFKQKAVGR